MQTSLLLFRRVKPVLIGESAGPDLVVFSLEVASRRPYCAVFPGRYAEGARRYAEKFPRIPVAVLEETVPAGAQAEESGNGLRYLGIDRSLDYYRAGLCAALLVRGEGTVAVLGNGPVTAAEREALLAGLREQGLDSEPRYLRYSGDPAQLRDISCLILTGFAGEFLEQNPDIPVILFSWLDPGLTPGSVKLIFDESPRALAAAAVGALRGRAEPLSSAAFLPGARNGPELARELKKALAGNPGTGGF
jgi:hypothetical protein